MTGWRTPFMHRHPSFSPSQRQLRVGEEIRHALAWIIERGELRHPALTNVSLTVTEVRVSPDLRQATVFVAPFAAGEVEIILDALARAKGFLRRRVADAVQLRRAPDLSFRADDSFDEAGRISEILRQPEVARDIVAVDDADDTRTTKEGRDHDR